MNHPVVDATCTPVVEPLIPEWEQSAKRWRESEREKSRVDDRET
jgi:hypothetical protein